MTQCSNTIPSPVKANLTAPFDAADLIVAYLEHIGIEYIFGIPGGAVEPLFNAMARSQRRGGLRPIVARHETGAAFMAEGYARETGRIGVCVATSGPGATNLITGVSCAYDNSVPLLVLTGQPALPSFGRRSFQESGCTGINIVGMFSHCTRYNSLVSHPEQTENKLVNALLRAHQARGPAHLSIPVDVLRSPLERGARAYDLPALMKPRAQMDAGAVGEVRDELARARQVVFVVGGGCIDAVESIMQLVALTAARFVTTPDGKGLVNTGHPAYRGVFGFAGHTSAIETLADGPDLVIAIGAGMSEWNCAAWSDALLNDRLIHIDSSDENLARTPMARRHVLGHIPSICRRLADLLREAPRPATSRPAAVAAGRADGAAFMSGAASSDAAPIKPQRLMHELARRCPPTTRFLAEPGNSMNWAIHSLEGRDRRLGTPDGTSRGGSATQDRRRANAGWLRIAMDFCPMGWAIGAAVGVARGNPLCPVVCITGDGSYLMSGQEITVAATEGLTVLFVVMNDAALGMVKHGQRLTGAERIAFELPRVDFRRMAESMEIPAHVIDAPADFDAIDFEAVFRRRGPTLLDVRIDGEEVPPMSLRIDSLMKTS